VDTDEFQSYDSYYINMALDATWDDGLVLLALAQALERNIMVYRPSGEIVTIVPPQRNDDNDPRTSGVEALLQSLPGSQHM